ncbi:transcriptional regulator, AraC family [Paraglaciecola sp. T6c]|uniref:AraC family transcriptional regulator n=1 Tax=Pseudoalteromonas atlantica (strain T6c / ATCC BAA-1087) TaxID=3042615 RepID=UPI00005C5765|nr:helix-turn-helix domain-containing protein [Paraglaciecola sp. T6c]ABG39379.1 transcriptional regulator, AraC family [Paraglaciecola sp. T6c]
MDLLGDVLCSLNVFSHSIGIFKIGGSTHLHLTAMPTNFAFIFTSTEGECWIEVDCCPPRQLHIGDSVLILGGRAHRFGASLASEQKSFETLWAANGLPKFGETRDKPIYLSVDETEDSSSLLSLAFTVDEPAHHSLLKLLPPYIFVSKGSQLDTWLSAAFGFCQRELSHNTPGFSATAMNFTNLIFGEFVRSYLNSADLPHESWMRGLSDPRIGRALAMMHTRTAEQLMVSTMAKEVGMSRTSFARIFKTLVGQSPIDYLINCRMHKAAQYLLEGNHSIGKITEMIGYHSERAFRQAFIQRFGLSPSQFKKQQQKI